LQIVNKIAECAINPWRNIDKRDERIAELILVHRNDVARTPEAMAEFFAKEPKWTGGRFPYHFFIAKDGVVSQCAPLSIKTPGALSAANRISIQITVDGDFRKSKPSAEQWESLIQLCAMLRQWKPTLKLEGHTEAPGRSSDPKKVCPGDKLSMPALRLAVLDATERANKERLRANGVRI
jgi:N-acetyl-anhydromuramyl-L-alanine amidase AmpD